jgi:hypothetical protein
LMSTTSECNDFRITASTARMSSVMLDCISANDTEIDQINFDVILS